MDVQILVETTFENGKIQRRDIRRLERAPGNLAPESLGLRHGEANETLHRLQEAVPQYQINEAPEARRKCNDCGEQYVIPDDRGRSVDTRYGRFRVE